MSKFTCPVSMKVTQEQFDYLCKELNRLDYKDFDLTKTSSRSSSSGDFEFIVTNHGNGDVFTNLTKEAIHQHGRYYIDHYNPDLFLALAAMVDDENLHIGEWVLVESGGQGAYGANGGYGKIIKRPDTFNQINYCGILECKYAPLYIKNQNTVWGLAKEFKVRKLTKEEIIQFLSKTKTSNTMKNFINWAVRGSQDFKNFLQCNSQIPNKLGLVGDDVNGYYFIRDGFLNCDDHLPVHYEVISSSHLKEILKTQLSNKRYKLKNQYYFEAANSICGGMLDEDFVHESMSYNRLKEAGVLHWFEEVKEEIIIEGKTVQFEDEYVIIGCQRMLKSDLKNVYKSCEIIKKLSENSCKNIAIGDGKLMINLTDYSKEFKQIIDKIK